ncbi:hypothetical protein [Streptomyces sp. NPDC101150]|uniref:hypothetical protein n=1 Tax=Streptomyces sp. NPDC101150 TaxID=3366114 RepID=UPI003814F618
MVSWSGAAIAPVGLAFAVLRLPDGGSVDGLGTVLACGVVPQAAERPPGLWMTYRNTGEPTGKLVEARRECESG